MVSSLAFLLSLLGYLVSSLLGANIVDLNDAAIAPAERPASAPALCTPEPLQRQRSMAEVLMGGRGSSSKKTKQHTARAAVANLPAGQSLKSASMTPGSKKRKHQYSIEEVGNSDNSAGVRQQQRDANEIVDSMFIKTKDNPDRMRATLKRVVEHAALQEHLPAELKVKHTEKQQVAMKLGTNFQANHKAITAKRPAEQGGGSGSGQVQVRRQANSRPAKPAPFFFFLALGFALYWLLWPLAS